MKNKIVSFGIVVALTSLFSVAHGALPPKKSLIKSNRVSTLSKYNVNLRIALKGAMPFSVNTIAKAGKKSSVTEISSDGNTETFVQMMPRKSMRDQKNGLMIDVTVIRKIRGEVRASETMQIFAFENEESEMRLNARGRGQQDFAVAVLANPI